MSRTYYVTTPIYYVNDKPHIGHSYTTIAADVLARYFRAEGRDVRFLTGTDEHGIKIVKAAAERSLTPRQLADEVVVHFQNLWKDLNISHDDFIRTTEPRHENRVRELVRRLVEQGDIYSGKYEGWYDEGQEEFVTESAARDGDYKSAVSGQPLVRYSEPAYFFRLTQYVGRLQDHIRSHPAFILPEARRNEVVSKLQMGVEDLCISRSVEKLPWGVPMPNDPGHVVYVWIDALSNYYTACGLPEIGDDRDGQAKRYWPADVHLIGKDILWFHAVYWPCMLMALGVELPRCVFAHGWWTSEGKKMSKSLGNFISREVIGEICRDYGLDTYRYFLLQAVAFGSDGDFSREMLRQIYNTELANGVGNLLSRTVTMIEKYCGGVVPAPAAAAGKEETPVMDAAANLRKAAGNHMAGCDFHAYLADILELVRRTNIFIENTQPFSLAKDASRREELQSILHVCAEAVRIVLLYLAPVMPEAAARGLAQLGWRKPDARPEDPATHLGELGRWGGCLVGCKVTKGEALFPRKT